MLYPINSTHTQGVRKFTSGVQNQLTFRENHHTRGGVSHQWRGPSYVLDSPQSRFLHLDEYDDSPEQEKQMLRGNHWCQFYTPEPIIDHPHDPAHLEWPRHAVFYSARHNKWLNAHTDTLIPRDARLFYNEEDWIKYKGMVSLPKIPGSSFKEVAERQGRAFSDPIGIRKGKGIRREDTKFYF